jgi:hypothetical protein
MVHTTRKRKLHPSGVDPHWYETKVVKGAGPVNGVPKFLSSAHSELFGIATPNEFLHHFMKNSTRLTVQAK